MALTGLTNLQPLHIKTVGIGTFDNTVSIGGTLTYEDVTNVDAIGIITARDDINIITDGKKLNIGASADLQLHHTSNHSYIDDAGAGNLRLRSGTLEIQNLASSKTSAVFSSGGGQTLNFNNQTKFVTTNTGVVITGICTATSFSGDGSGLTGLPAGTTINNNANNRVITGSDTAGTLEGETKLTFDPTTTQLKITKDDDSNSGFYVFHNDGNECARLVNKGSGHEGALLLQDGGTPTVYFDGETGSRSYINTGAGLAIGTQNLVSGRADNVLHLHKASSGTADGPTIYFTNQQTGVTGSDGFTVGINDTQSPYIWNRENTDLRFGTNNAERVRIKNDGRIGINANPSVNHEYLHMKPVGNNVLDLRYELNSDTDIRHKFYDNTGTQRGTFGYTTYANSSTYPNFHDSFYLQTDPGSNGSLATVMWINRDGQFIKPYTYKFLVETNGTSVSGGWNKLTGLTIDSSYSTGVSNGTYWSNSNQRFTAPVSGTYYFFIGGFSSTAEGGGTNHRYMYVFQVNGSGLKYGFGGNYSDNNTPMEGGSMHIPLNVNDYVEVQYYTAISATWGAGHRFFWGGYFLG